LLYVKDRQIENLAQRTRHIQRNLVSIVDARIFEKGNALVFQLDQSNRLLAIFKETYKGLEASVRATVLSQ
jgi:hypothetical protein